MNRRNFIEFASQAVLSAAFSNCKISKAHSSETFRLFNQLHFRNMPLEVKSLLSPISVVYADQLWANGVMEDYLDFEYMTQRFGNGKIANDNRLICLDIENWKYRNVSPQELDNTIERFIALISFFRALYPGYLIGIFEFFPTALYPLYDHLGRGLASSRLLKQWRDEQIQLRRIDAHIDVLFPQLYSRWPNEPAVWIKCARRVMKEATNISGGRKVFPFLWPQFWYKDAPIVPGFYWKRMLETVFAQADGAVIWSIYKTAPEWDPAYAWWYETQLFASSISR